MAEQYNLTTPITPPSRVNYRVMSIYLSPESSLIVAQLRGSDNAVVVCEYSGAEARTLLNQLNTMDFSTISIQKRLLQRLQTDGKLPNGSITGTPD